MEIRLNKLIDYMN